MSTHGADSEVGTLQTVMLHRPGPELKRLTPRNNDVLLFDGLHIKAAGASMPQSINYLPLSVGGALMVLFALNRFVRVLRAAPAGEGH